MWQAIEDRGLDIAAHSGLFGDGTGEFWMAPNFAYNGICNAATYRVDVLEAVGIDPPTTTEELREVTMAVKAEFPDMIPIMTRAQWATLMWFREMFGVKFAPMGAVEEATDAYRDMLRFLADLYVNGLIDQEWITGTEEQLKQAYNAGRVTFEYGFGAFSMPGRKGAFMAEHGITAADHEASNTSEAAAKAYAARYHEVIGFLDPITVNPGDTRGPGVHHQHPRWLLGQRSVGEHHRGGTRTQPCGCSTGSTRRTPAATIPAAGASRESAGTSMPTASARALPSKDPGFIGEAAFRMMSDVGRLSSNALYHTLRTWIDAWGTAPSWKPAT